MKCLSHFKMCLDKVSVVCAQNDSAVVLKAGLSQGFEVGGLIVGVDG